MAKEFDVQVLNTTIMGVLEDTFKRMFDVEFSAEPSSVKKNIIEYNSRMRVFPLEKFEEDVYISYVNYYLSTKDMELGHTIGTFVLFVKEEIVSKLMIGFGRSINDSDNESIVLDVIGELCNIVAGNLKNELVSLGYADLTLSSPQKYKNDLPEGVPFDYSLYEKQEISLHLWNDKCIVIEACMGNVPMKGK